MKQTKLPNGDMIYSIDKLSAIDVYEEIYEDNVYLLNDIQLHAGDVVFDVGANIGLFSKFASEKFPDLKIYAFEPIPQIFEAMNANLKDKPNIKMYNIGLSDSEKDAEFNYYPKVSADSTSNPFDMEKQIDLFLQSYNKRAAKILPKKALRYIIGKKLKSMYKTVKITCPLRTLSQMIEENHVEKIDLLKLDAENAERQVLAGIKDADWEKIKQVAMEIHTTSPDGETLVDDICDLFEAKGFKYVLDTKSRFSFIGVHMFYAKR